MTESLLELKVERYAELTPEEIAHNSTRIRTHPALSEAVKDTAHGLMGHMINLWF